MNGAKNDQDKIRLDLIPPECLFSLGKVLTYGAKKYEPNNWRKGIDFSRVYAALLRHLFDWWGGKWRDDESGFGHLEQAFCELMFLLYYELNYHIYEDFDDRYVEDKAAYLYQPPYKGRWSRNDKREHSPSAERGDGPAPSG